MRTSPMNALANHLDWMALLIGGVGSFLWAHNGRCAKYASVWWFFSSVLWVMFAWVKGLPALGLRDALGVSTTLYGCYRWLRPMDWLRYSRPSSASKPG